MSLSQSGNEFRSPSYVYAMAEPSQVGEARRFAQVLCADLAFDEISTGRIGIIVNELGNNLVNYATNGRLLIRKFDDGSSNGIEILSVDNGPGLTEATVMRDGFSTGATPGTGLGATRRQADLFEIYSQIGSGTVVVARVYAHKLHSESPRRKFEVGAVNVAIDGEFLCGDAWSEHQFQNGFATLVADGLGHGPLANKAAVAAVEAFDEISTASVDEQMRLIHQRLRGTRGAAVFLAAIEAETIHFAGVGNIRALIQTNEKSKTLISQNGTAGLQIGTIRVQSEPWDGDGYFILHSDGIHSRWNLTSHAGLLQKHPSIVKGVIYRDFSRGNDDETVVVFRRSE